MGLVATTSPTTTPYPVLRNLNSYTLKDPEWLWPNRLPKGKLVLLDGDPGVGKTTVALNVAATVSRGDTWPDQKIKQKYWIERCKRHPPLWKGTVIILSAEDDPEDTIGPRLKAAKADFGNIHILEGIEDGEREYEFKQGRRKKTVFYQKLTPFSLKKHIHQLRIAIRKHDAKLIVIDTLSAYMGGVDTHRDSDVRILLHPLARLARETGVTVLALRHLNKADEGRAMYRGQGSIGFTAQARAVWMVVRDPKDDEYRLLLPIKNNLAAEKDKTALRFTFDDSFGHSAPYIVWDPEPFKVTQADIEKLVQGKVPGPTQVEQAEDFLEAVLGDGQEMPRSEVEELAAQRNIKPWALEKAKKSLGVKHRTDGQQGPSLWKLPQSRGQQRDDGPEIQVTQSRGTPRVRLSRDSSHSISGREGAGSPRDWNSRGLIRRRYGMAEYRTMRNKERERRLAEYNAKDAGADFGGVWVDATEAEGEGHWVCPFD